LGQRKLVFIEVPVPSPEIDRSCIYVLGISILPLNAIFQLILELFRQCGIFVQFYLNNESLHDNDISNINMG
jgi:hypothetical protein